MSGKWSVKKRDGAWQAFDEDGNVRSASSDYLKALAFGLIGGEKLSHLGVCLTWSAEDLQKFWSDPDWWKKHFGL